MRKGSREGNSDPKSLLEIVSDATNKRAVQRETNPRMAELGKYLAHGAEAQGWSELASSENSDDLLAINVEYLLSLWEFLVHDLDKGEISPSLLKSIEKGRTDAIDTLMRMPNGLNQFVEKFGKAHATNMLLEAYKHQMESAVDSAKKDRDGKPDPEVFDALKKLMQS